ncbi:pirin family protein [Pelistega suis]|uniref:Pirin family protein n=1 Tax=Pelistega suis TaxID=1631957 RepID=A0A849P6M8_9BURK|nr:pirin family protein [Pelistega suis]MDY3332026.1 pirin family protein [Pelistega sp.]NOL51208.1 pirin family protein [Pelistega suis]
MSIRSITTIYAADKAVDNGDILLWRALPLPQRYSLGPYVFIDHYSHKGLRGIGDRPHPHAGIEVISYIIDGGVAHRDSFGFKDTINAGDAQWICAGKGIIHAEQPTAPRHGLQLWTSLPPSKKMLDPAYRSYRKEEIPVFEKDGAQIRVIAGTVDGVKGPLATITENTFAYISLPAHGQLRLTVPAQELGIYVTKGKLAIGEGQTLGVEGLAILSDGDEVVLQAAEEPVELALLGGEPAEGPILFDGPFVMDTVERLQQAYSDYHSGKMGTLQ